MEFSQTFWGTLGLSIILILLEIQKINGNIVWMEATDCPMTNATWNKRGMVVCGNEHFKYHCLLDVSNVLRETCIPAVEIVSGGCPLITMVLSQPGHLAATSECLQNNPKCPPAKYLTNETFRYPACYKRIGEREFIEETSTKGVTTETESIEPIGSITQSGNQEELFPINMLPVSLGVAVPIAIMIFILLWIKLRRRRKRDTRPNDKDKEEDAHVPLRENDEDKICTGQSSKNMTAAAWLKSKLPITGRTKKELEKLRQENEGLKAWKDNAEDKERKLQEEKAELAELGRQTEKEKEHYKARMDHAENTARRLQVENTDLVEQREQSDKEKEFLRTLLDETDRKLKEQNTEIEEQRYQSEKERTVMQERYEKALCNARKEEDKKIKEIKSEFKKTESELKTNIQRLEKERNELSDNHKKYMKKADLLLKEQKDINAETLVLKKKIEEENVECDDLEKHKKSLASLQDQERQRTKELNKLNQLLEDTYSQLQENKTEQTKVRRRASLRRGDSVKKLEEIPQLTSKKGQHGKDISF